MSQNIISISRIILGIFIVLIGISFLIPPQIRLSGDLTDIIGIMFITISILIGLIFMYGGYLLLADHKERFPTVATFLLLFGISALLLNSSLNIFTVLPFYIGPAVLIFVIWKFDHHHKHHPVKRAREFFGEHVKHLSDEELHHHIKH